MQYSQIVIFSRENIENNLTNNNIIEIKFLYKYTEYNTENKIS